MNRDDYDFAIRQQTFIGARAIGMLSALIRDCGKDLAECHHKQAKELIELWDAARAKEDAAIADRQNEEVRKSC